MDHTIIPDLIRFINRYMNHDFIVDKNCIYLNFNGGEPLLNFAFIKIFVPELKKNGIVNYSISTNFTVVNDEIMTFLAENAYAVQISLDGDNVSHNHHRMYHDGSGSFNTVYNNIIKYKKQLEICNTSISIVVTPETIKNMYSNINFMYKTGLRNITVSLCLDYDWMDSAIQEYEAQIDKCAELYKKSYDSGNVLRLSLFDRVIEMTIRNFKGRSCGICKDEIGIAVNGDVYACSLFFNNHNDKTHVVGTIYNGVDIEKTKAYLNSSLLDLSSCEGCLLSNRCHNECYANNYRIYGDIKKGAERYCWINKKVIMTSDILLDYLIKTRNKILFSQYKDILGA
jgi:uncharacterized protein